MAKDRYFSMVAVRWLPVLLFAALTLAFAHFFLFHLNNDATAYFSLGRAYARGDLQSAVNAYWSPLLPWLLGLSLHFGLSELVAAKIILSFAGCVSLFALGSIARSRALPTRTALLVLLIASVLLFTYAVDVVTPDLLLCAAMLCYLAVALRSDYPKRLSSAVWCGFFAAVAFYAKSVALPLFLLHFLLLHGLLLAERFIARGKIFAQAALGFLVFALLTAPWILTISAKAGHFTIGESSRVIHASLNPLEANALPMTTRGLIPPPTPSGISMWDDPTQIAHPYWSPFDSSSAFLDQLKIVVINAVDLLRSLLPLYWLLPVLLCWQALLCFPLSQGIRKRRIEILSLSFTALLVLGYLPFVVEVRYFWPAILLALVAAGSLLQELIRTGFLTSPRRSVAEVFLVASFIAVPVWNAVLKVNDGKVAMLQATRVNHTLQLTDKRIAADRWKNGLLFSYFAGGHYYGQPKSSQSTAQVEAELLASKIDAYLVWGEKPIGFKQFADATPADVTQLRVFVPKK